jgi:uncharacterized membrane protein YozB (DUF420 family)
MVNLSQPAGTPREAWARKALYIAVAVATAYLAYYVLILGWSSSSEWLVPPHDVLLPVALTVWGIFTVLHVYSRRY